MPDMQVAQKNEVDTRMNLYGRSTQDGSLKSSLSMQRVEQPDNDEYDRDYYLQQDD